MARRRTRAPLTASPPLAATSRHGIPSRLRARRFRTSALSRSLGKRRQPSDRAFCRRATTVRGDRRTGRVRAGEATGARLRRAGARPAVATRRRQPGSPPKAIRRGHRAVTGQGGGRQDKAFKRSPAPFAGLRRRPRFRPLRRHPAGTSQRIASCTGQPACPTHGPTSPRPAHCSRSLGLTLGVERPPTLLLRSVSRTWPIAAVSDAEAWLRQRPERSGDGNKPLLQQRSRHGVPHLPDQLYRRLLLGFDLMRVMRTPYRIDDFQQVYFVAP